MHRPFASSCLSRRFPPLLAALFLMAVPASAQDASSTAPAGPVRVRFETTKGAFTVELDAVRAPLSVTNLLQYVRDGHYDGTIFHRVIGNFVVQGGGYLASGAERPTRPAVVNESGNGLSNRRGTVAMARSEHPHSATSQFYVNLTDNLALDPGPTRWGYAVIGRVVEGMDVIDQIASVATGGHGPFPEDAPLEPILIQSARVVTGPAAVSGT
ncbi:MAG TPA: peptidylprolyl isomerase [Steroidobacteraceae bacterium]|nr:peptidylprolyl isomerase [Steroidobacteraceae bacterium]